MSDQTPPPQPRYGEYAPGYQPGATPPPPASYSYGPPPIGAPPSGPRTRKTWDVVLTVVLLVLGLVGLLLGLLYAALLPSPEFAAMFSEILGQQGVNAGPIDFGAFPAVIVVSHLVLYLAALGISIPMLLRKVVAFWVPLTAGVIAALIFWGGYLGIVTGSLDLSGLAGL